MTDKSDEQIVQECRDDSEENRRNKTQSERLEEDAHKARSLDMWGKGRHELSDRTDKDN